MLRVRSLVVWVLVPPEDVDSHGLSSLSVGRYLALREKYTIVEREVKTKQTQIAGAVTWRGRQREEKGERRFAPDEDIANIGSSGSTLHAPFQYPSIYKHPLLKRFEEASKGMGGPNAFRPNKHSAYEEPFRVVR